MAAQYWIVIGTVTVFVVLGIMLTLSIKKHDAKKASSKKKKGRNRYMPQYKGPKQ